MKMLVMKERMAELVASRIRIGRVVKNPAEAETNCRIDFKREFSRIPWNFDGITAFD